MMKIHTVAAGGGSILHFDGARFRVGPDSAGADPGPACYRRGGPLAVTDANVMTGKLIPDFFPKVFGPPATSRSTRDRCASAFEALAGEIGDGREPEAVADGFLAIAVAKMAEAIKTISVARGYDVTRYALNCFGGAGGQHACDVADALAITTVLIHPLSSLLSAYGMGLADIARPARRKGSRSRSTRAGACPRRPRVATRWPRRPQRRSQVRASAPRGDQDSSPRAAALRRLRHDDRGRARAAGRDAARFRARAQEPLRLHRSRPRRSSSRRCRVEAIGGAARFAERARQAAAHGAARARRCATRFFSQRRLARGERLSARARCRPARVIDGPALVIEPHQTIVVEQGWRAEITAQEPCASCAASRPLPRSARRSAPRPIR